MYNHVDFLEAFVAYKAAQERIEERLTPIVESIVRARTDTLPNDLDYSIVNADSTALYISATWWEDKHWITVPAEWLLLSPKNVFDLEKKRLIQEAADRQAQYQARKKNARRAQYLRLKEEFENE